MNFAGIQKTTLIDYPGKVAATLFVHGCNFRCPFCHNPELVIEKQNVFISEDEIFEFLNKRRGKLDGIVITGGEPLTYDLLPFIKRVKKMGFLVKVDTNGSFPSRIKDLIKYVDYWAMDVKNSLDLYEKTVGIPVDTSVILKSIELIRNGAKDYELRTTVVPGLHDESSIREIGKIVKGAKRYVIQNFVGGKTIDPVYDNKRGFGENELRRFEKAILPYVKSVEIIDN